jgi:Predicted membrane protein (DUF2157)
MFERVYRQRLNADLARWEGDGVVSPSAAAAIRGALPPLSPAVNIATVIAILGALLIAAAFLAFVASNWGAIARPMRFAILVAGIICAYGIGAAFARGNRNILADVSACVGSIVFGAAIALVGQMYHLAGDFAAGMMLWSVGALVAAVATGSRGALAVALTVGCIWSGMRVMETHQVPHLAFVALWLIAAAVAVVWNSVVARHLVAVAAVVWWGVAQIGFDDVAPSAPIGTLVAGSTLLLGAGLALAGLRTELLRPFGLTLSTYGAFSLAFASGVGVFLVNDAQRATFSAEMWATICGIIGVALALTAAAMAKRAGPAFAALAGGIVLLVGAGTWWPTSGGEPWLVYAMLLAAMLCLVVSGMLDAAGPRVVAGWLGLAAVIAGITWAVQGSLIRRAVFLCIAGLAAVGLAAALRLVRPKEQPE